MSAFHPLRTFRMRGMIARKPGGPTSEVAATGPREIPCRMDLTRRDRLRTRRQLMQLRLHRRQLSKTFMQVAQELCARGVRLSKSMPEANNRSLGPLAAGPGQDEELHFDWIANAIVGRWSTEGEATDMVRDALAACSRPDDLVSVIWSPFEAGMRLRASDLARHAGVVLHRDWTIWIVAAQPSSWIVQIGRRSRTVAYSPKVPVRTDSAHRRYPSGA